MRYVGVFGKLCPSVTTIAGWLVPPLFGREPYEQLSARIWYDRGWCDGQLGTPSQKPGENNAAARGTAVHEEIEHYVNTGEQKQYNKNNAHDAKVMVAVVAIDWLRKCGWDLKAEVKLSCLGGRVGGTADLVAVNREAKVIKIIDWKTGGFYPIYPIQLELLKTAFFPAAYEGWTLEASDFVLGKPWGDEALLSVPRGGLKLAWDVAGASTPPTGAEAAYSVSEVDMLKLFRWVENG
jgi:hypothetical protein